MSSFMSSALNAETQAWRGIAVVNQSVDQANRRLSNANQPRSECSNGTGSGCAPGPSRLGQVPEPPNFAGPPLNDMSAIRDVLVQLASDSQLQAFSPMTMTAGRHLVVWSPFSFSVGICRPSLLGFQSGAALQ